MQSYKLLHAGDSALVMEFGERIDRAVNQTVLGLAGRLRAARLDGVIEILPTFRSLMVQFDPLRISCEEIVRHADRLLTGLRAAEMSGRHWCLPVCYDADLACDLQEVAVRTGLSVRQVVERHCSVTYHCYMLGFLPGQAYMGDLPTELALPRRESPRARIPVGSVAMATTMTCIFPLETPCGWHIVGRSPVRLWDSKAGSVPLLAPGDKVTFAPVSLREFEWLDGKASAGQLKLVPVDTMEAVA
jgi:KipI family sensor histidine kinase inhibitor